MVIRVAVSAARKAIESLYTDRGVITEYQSYKKENGAIGQREVITVQNQPCRISFSNISTTDATRTVSEYAQTVKLFLSPDIVVKAGSKITVERNGIVTAYRNSGESAKYDTHQEIPLELFERWA